MIRGRVRLRGYHGWQVTYFVAADGDDMDEIMDEMRAVGSSRKAMRRVRSMMNGRCCNVGYTWSSGKLRKSVITISQTKDFSEIINTFVHELDHVAKHVTLAMDIDPYSEQASYLIGELARDIFIDITEKFICRKK